MASSTSLPGLPLDATASLLGKLDNNVSPEDLALGFMLGRIKIKGLSLDVSAVIFIALLFLGLKEVLWH